MVGINKKTFLLVCLFIIPIFSSVAQEKRYILYFKDKKNNSFSISKPTDFLSERALIRRKNQNISITNQDLPVSPSYLENICTYGASVLTTLKWFNAALVMADTSVMNEIKQLSFIERIVLLSDEIKSNSFPAITSFNSINQSENYPYGNSYNQIAMLEADKMHQANYTGEGKLIALLDAGFANAPTVNCLSHLFTNNRIVSTYDFVDYETDVYDDHFHGLNVLSAIAAYKEDTLIGTAYGASYVLLRTENVFSETEQEEINWAKGAEYADSIGADIISSSLGYAGFDVPSTSHSYQDMDGNTSIVVKAADHAASLGILVLSSAGNEGAAAWHYILTPSDGDSVLSIGAVDQNEKHASFSSYGPSSDNRVKPDLAARGQSVILATHTTGYGVSNGTSFSCPLVAGLAAGIWQAYPSLTNMQLAEVMKRSASQYYTPDFELGYGIPGYLKAKKYIEDSIAFSNIELRVFPNPAVEGPIYFAVNSAYFNKTITIKLLDFAGRQVAQEDVTIKSYQNEIPFAMQNIRSGLYFLQFYFRDKIVNVKLLKY